MSGFLSQLGTAATSPLAFVAYVFALVAWTVIGLKIQRTRVLLDRLEKLPSRDRADVLRAEMGAVPLAKGLTPEQWLRSRKHTYFFIAFGIACATLIVLVLIARVTGPQQASGKVETSITPVDSPVDSGPESPPASSASAQSMESSGPPSEQGQQAPFSGPPPNSTTDALTQSAASRTLRYRARSDHDTLVIEPEIGYLDALRQAGTIRGVLSIEPAFRWSFPRISIKAVNNSPNRIVIASARIAVRRSTLVMVAIPVFQDRTYNTLTIANEGWAPVVNPRLQFRIAKSPACRTPETISDGDAVDTTLATFDEGVKIDIVDFVPSSLWNEPELCVAGTMAFGPLTETRKSVQFATRVLQNIRAAAPLPPSACYDIHLEAGQAPVNVDVPLEEDLAPGAADHFIFRLGTNKSARFEMEISFRAIGGSAVPGGNVVAEVFVPRSLSSLARRADDCPDASTQAERHSDK